MEFRDKNGTLIEAGAFIRHDNGDIEEVFSTTTASGDESLGIMATNPAYLKNHPDCEIEYYDLSNFNLKEWEIVQEVQL